MSVTHPTKAELAAIDKLGPLDRAEVDSLAGLDQEELQALIDAGNEPVAPSPDPASEPVTAAGGAPGPVVPGDGSEAVSGDVSVYLAQRSMAGVVAGKTFEAGPDDPRVKSGYAALVGPVEPEAPAEVKAALDGTGSSAG